MPFAPGNIEAGFFLAIPTVRTKLCPILDLYEHVWEGAPLAANDFVTSADEKSRIQRRRRQPTKPSAPNRPMRVEHE